MASGEQGIGPEISSDQSARALGEPRVSDLAARRRQLAGVRAALALLCLAIQFLPGLPAAGSLPFLTAIFVLYSLAVLVWQPAIKVGSELLGLIADTIFFLIFVAFCAGSDLWLSSAFYVYLLLSAILVHHWWDVSIVAGICIGFLAITRTMKGDDLWGLVLWGGLLACAVSVEKSRVDRRLAAAIREAEDFRLRAERARESERQRMAGDFHDGPLQGFISLQLRLETLRKILGRNPDAGLEEVRQIQEVWRSQISELRAFVKSMRAVEVGGDGLVASLRRVAADFQKESGITINFRSGRSINVESPERSLEVIQIVREALHNIQKHSSATQAALTVNQFTGFLEISVEDNGGGFGFSGTFNLEELELLRLGPASIKQRVKNLGGQVVVDSRPAHGASLRVRVPA